MQGQSIGYLEFFYSTMQGGKGTALLQHRHNLLAIGKTVRVLTSASDDRFGTGRVTSRMGPYCDADVFNDSTVFSLGEFGGVDQLFIDEAQFLRPDQVRLALQTPRKMHLYASESINIVKFSSQILKGICQDRNVTSRRSLLGNRDMIISADAGASTDAWNNARLLADPLWSADA